MRWQTCEGFGMSGFTPSNQLRLTNVAYVRLQKGGKRFEIACYKNKVINWRSKVETNLKEVLQIDNIFTNVSKGAMASNKDLQDAFGSTDKDAVCREILERGELQVSEQERAALLETIFRDVASIVADKAINSENSRPYPVSIIQNAMKQIHYSVSTVKSSKSQALDVIRKLKDVMPITRASMLLRLLVPSIWAEEMQIRLMTELGIAIELFRDDTIDTPVLSDPSSLAAPLTHSENDNAVVAAPVSLTTVPPPSAPKAPLPTQGASKLIHTDIFVDPELYRKIELLVDTVTGSKGRVEVLKLCSASSVHASASSSVGPPPPTLLLSSNLSTVKESVAEEDIESEDNDENGCRGDGEEREDDSSNDDNNSISGVVDKVRSKPKKNKKKVKSGKLAEVGGLRGAESSNVWNVESRAAVATSTGKKGKRAKRAEKELLKEREAKAQVLRARIDTVTTSQLRAGYGGVGCGDQPSSISSSGSVLPAPGPGGDGDGEMTMVSPSLRGTAEWDRNSGDSGDTVDNNNKAQILSSGCSPATTAAVPAPKSCNTCGGRFDDPSAYRSHFKSEWHAFNLRRKMKGLNVVPSNEAFMTLSLEELVLGEDRPLK